MIPSYVYKITLLSSGQFYYGSRTANVRFNRHPTADLWVCYTTSSRIITRLLAEHGKDAFLAEVIHSSTDGDDTYWTEQEFIKQHIDNPLCLNRKFQDRTSGDTIFSTAGKEPWNKGIPSKYKGIPRSPEVIAKMSANRKGKATGLTPWMKGRTQPAEAKAAQHTKMKGRFVGDLNPFKGKTHTNEVKAAIALNTSRAQKGRAKPKS